MHAARATKIEQPKFLTQRSIANGRAGAIQNRRVYRDFDFVLVDDATGAL